MKTVILMPSEAECDVIVRDQQGKEVKISSIEITPTFWHPKATPGLLFFETHLDDYIEEEEGGKSSEVQGQLLQRGAITLSGTTGKLTVSDRTKAVSSHFESHLEVAAERIEATLGAANDEKQDEDEEPVRRKKKGAR